MKISIFFKAILSIPKTIVFNFLHLPMKQAIKLPIWVHYSTSMSVRGGGKN